jgi:hypothetical protein
VNAKVFFLAPPDTTLALAGSARVVPEAKRSGRIGVAYLAGFAVQMYGSKKNIKFQEIAE